MEIILASPFSPLQQRIIYGFLLWAVMSGSIYAVLWGGDHGYKSEFNSNSFYKLGKIRWLFVYYDRKSRQIAKFIFWLNILSHIWIISALYFNIAFAFNQNETNAFYSSRLTLGLIGLLTVIGLIGLYKKLRYDKIHGKKEEDE